jgi:uncharacterized coiled-coil protein SlyX
MDEHREQERQEIIEERTSSTSGWLVFLAVLALVAAGIAFAYGYQQQAKVNDLNSHQAELNATLSEMQMHVDSMTSKLNDVSAQQAAAAQAAAKAQTVAASPANAKAARAVRAANEKRFKELQTQLEDQSRTLKDTQDSLDRARSDLEGNISTTRTELTGSIARTHDELVALAKRGERSYFEFDLTKSKDFKRAGPIQISLRKADTKNKRFNLMMLVDDNKLTKNNVNLFEPIWLNTEGLPQPVQVVVNKITKNQIHGYVSAPKYRESELSASTPRTAPPEQNQNPPEKPPQF